MSEMRIGVWDMNSLSFFFLFFGRFISDFHFLLLNERHSARQTENQKRSMDWNGGVTFGANRRLFIMIFLGEGGEGGVLSSLSPGLVNW